MHRYLRNRIFLPFDLIAWMLIPVLALALRLDWPVPFGRYQVRLAAYGAVGIACKFVIFYLFGLYRRYWRFASVGDLLAIASAVLVAGVAIPAIYFGFVGPYVAPHLGAPPFPRLPRSLPVIDALLTMVFFGGSRFAVRVADALDRRQQGHGNPKERVLIVGAGEAGALLAKELLANPHRGLTPVGLVDDDPDKRGRTIHGLPVLGGLSDLPRLAAARHVRKAIIAMPAAPGSVIRKVRELCRQAGLETKTVPGIFDILSGKVRVSHLRDVEIEDLLRRDPVVTDREAAAKLVRGATVLVTGAGGSIGSEICRQVASLGAGRIVLLDHAENSVFLVHNELTGGQWPGLEVVPVIADIRHARRVRQVLAAWRPNVVFHAAAHKHVPLMEWNPLEAITNNVGGTLNVLEAAEVAEVQHFVFISTDKAVNAESIMGATKLIGEGLVHDAAVRTGRHYVSVRFGNVLGSAGSVVPLFREQIARGGPVTITHPEMRRFFMTIPEAVQLVLQAAAFAEGGETYVLDMGEPVRIVDLAHDLIRLSGLEVGRDVEIVFTGIRPGERLSEELFLPDEVRQPTAHEKIFVARNGRARQLRGNTVTRLVAAAEAGDLGRVHGCLEELLPGWRIRLAALDASDEHGAGAGPPVEPGRKLGAVAEPKD